MHSTFDQSRVVPNAHDPSSSSVNDLNDLVSWSFREMPLSRADVARMVLPVGAIVTPLKPRTNQDAIEQVAAFVAAHSNDGCVLESMTGDPMILRGPKYCSVCHAVLNPYCTIDLQSRTWTCCMCSSRTDLIDSNGSVDHDVRIAPEMNPCCSAVTYRLCPPVPEFFNVPVVFFFVIDTSLPTVEELQAMKERLLQSIAALPADVHVGLITYGAAVYLHELKSDTPLEFRCCHTFRGSTELNVTMVREAIQADTHGNRFTFPVTSAEFILTQIIEDLKVDRWPVPTGTRPRRCTGAAISLATCVMEIFHSMTPGRIITCLSGISCEGPGKAAELGKEHLIRGHGDIRDRTTPAKDYNHSCAFYERLMKQLIKNSHCLDVFSVCLDQTGIAELRTCVQLTGGTLVLCDTWARPHLKQTMEQFIQRPAERVGAKGESFAALEHMAFDVSFEVQTSLAWRVSGAIGPCTGNISLVSHTSPVTTIRSENEDTKGNASSTPFLRRFTSPFSRGSSVNTKQELAYAAARQKCISDTEVGMGGTVCWVTSVMEDDVAIAVYLDAAPMTPDQLQNLERQLTTAGHYRFVQFTTTYLHHSGERRMRVLTVPHRIQKVTNYPALVPGFDQEVATVLMAKLCSYRTETTSLIELLRWLDRHLIRFVSRFAEYRKDEPGSLRLDRTMSLFPVFMYHLRRSPILSCFNSSPDETAILRFSLTRADTRHAMLMVHPTLHAYSMNVQGDGGPPVIVRPVSLDPSSIHPESILLLDTFFDLLIFHGETIAAWVRQGYHHQEEYEHFREFLSVPQEAARKLVPSRQPAPIVITCAQGSPPARILLNKINPARGGMGTALPVQGAGPGGAPNAEDALLWSDDVTLQTFVEHLKKAVVQNQK